MDANFFYYSIYDRFVQRQPCACVCACICKCFFKKLLRNYQLNLRNFTGVFLRKLLFTVTEKSEIRPVERYRRSSASSYDGHQFNKW